MAEILIIDDEPAITRIISHTLSAADHSIRCAHSISDGLATGMAHQSEVVVLDVMLPDGNGLKRVDEFMSLPSAPEIIIITAYSEQNGAELALESGVFDYLQKPFNRHDVMLACTRALEFRLSRMKTADVKLLRCEGIIGKSVGIRQCLDTVARASSSHHSILITGETGTGKELFARAIHENSPRAKYPFVVVDCAALKSTLLESTLFGHEKGAYTGADSRHEGFVRLAHQGTLFLDEIGELTLESQKKFLRLLESRQYYPLGSKKKLHSDFRLVSATNRDLEAMVLQGNFRLDLLHRIRGQEIRLPALRERKEDIHPLVYHHVEGACRRIGMKPKKVYPDFLDALALFDWPGNVRELINTLDECISGFPEDPYLQTRHLPMRVRVSIKELLSEAVPGGELAGEPLWHGCMPEQLGSPVPDSFHTPSDWRTFRKQSIEFVEKNYFADLFSRTGGNVKEIASLSGVTPARVYDLVKKHGIGKA